jgi:Trypsin-co-occurring domain 1
LRWIKSAAKEVKCQGSSSWERILASSSRSTTQRIAADAGERALERVSGSLEGALANIHKVAIGLYETLVKMPRAPDTAKFEFGVKLTGGAGIIIASGTAEANLKVTLDWKAPANA